MSRRLRIWLIVWIAIGTALRLGAAAGLDAVRPYAGTGGDSGWYLANGYTLVTGTQPCPDAIQFPARLLPLRALAAAPMPYSCTVTDVERLPTPPLYLIVVGAAQAIAGLQSAEALVLIRAVQIALSALTIALAAAIAGRVGGGRAAGAAAVIFALHPGLIVEAGQIVSETVFVLLSAAGLWAFIVGMQPGGAASQRRASLALLLAGVSFGLAALTRASILAFPFALLVYGLLVGRGRRRWLAFVSFGLVYVLTVGTWTAYTYASSGRFVIGGEGLAAFLYVGATGWDDPTAVDDRLEAQTGVAAETASQGDFLAAAGQSITADVPGYVARRVRELAGALIQPHGTTYYGGPSLRDLAAAWWNDDRTLPGLAALTSAEAFWPKLALYLAHYGLIGLAVIGAVRTRRRWRISLVLIGWISYLLAVHLALLALPRYLFPGVIGWGALAAGVWASLPVQPGDQQVEG